MEHVKYLVIGAGISGLSFANHADDYLIIEKENEVGGYCRTIRQGDFVWDYAGHFFHFKTDEFRRKFLGAIPEQDVIFQDKCTKIYYNDDLIDYPFQMNIHQLQKEEFIDCLYDLFNKVEKEQYDSFLDMLYGKFGKSIVNKFLKPYNEKLYAVDLTQLDVDAMGRFFPYADREAIINNMKENLNRSYNNSFLYPVHGASSFINILADNIDKDNLRLHTSAEQIDPEQKTVTLSDGETIRYDYLINSMPLNRFLPMIGERTLAGRLSYNKVLVFNLGFNEKSDFTKEHWIYIPDRECNYYRAGFYDNILGQEKLSMYIEIGYGRDADITDDEIETQLALTLTNLKKQGILHGGMELEAHTAIVMDPAYVHINRDTDRAVKALFDALKRKDIYSIGRYGGWTYCSMEDCMIEAKALAEKLQYD